MIDVLRRARGSRLLTNIASLMSLQMANFLIPLITLPYLTRTLGIERFGLFAFSQALCMYFVLLTEFGFNLSTTRRIAADRDDHQRIALLFWSTLAARAALGLACLSILFLVVSLIPALRAEFWVYVAASCPIVAAVITPVWYFQGMEIIKSLAITQVLTRAAFAGLTFLVVAGPQDTAMAVAFQGYGPLVAGALCWFFIVRLAPVSRAKPTVSQVRQRLKEGWHVFLSSAAISLYTTSNVFVLGLVAGNVQVGYFSIAEKITRAATGFVAPISQAVYPRVSFLISTASSTAHKVLRQTLVAFCGIGATLCVVIALVPELFLGILGGPEALPAITTLQILSAIPLIVGISSVFGTLTMLNYGMEKEFSRVVLYLGVANIVLLVALSHFFEANGAAISLLMTEALVVLLTGSLLRKRGLLGEIFLPGKASRRL